MKLCLLLLFALQAYLCNSQNVGIGTLTPSEKLDVNGNVNITGTLKTNGMAGQSGQVLMSTGTGLSWGSTAGYRKAKSFSGNATFNVPAGVTEVMVEAWGGGSGGTLNNGGTSGGYARTVRIVVPGDAINITIGLGSNYGATSTSAGGTTSVNFGGNILNAFGGGGVFNANTKGTQQSGSTTGVFDNAYFQYGAEGKATTSSGFASSATTFVEIVNYGAGGISVGFQDPVASEGDHLRVENGNTINGATVVGQNAKLPGAGGPAGYGAGGWPGANGFVVIWWN